jgi:hypothetical protein
MKRLAISFLMGVCLIAGAKDKSIQEFILDEQTVYSIPVSGFRVTTISFPGPISAMDAAQVTIDPQKPAAFLIAHTKGSSFFSVRAEARKAVTNVNIRWNNKTYVLELVESDEPLLSVTFEVPPDNSASVQADPVTPSRLLALLDKAKAYPLLKAYHSETVAQVEYRNFEKEPRILDCTNYAVRIVEAFRFNPEDTLIFRVGVTNKTDNGNFAMRPMGFRSASASALIRSPSAMPAALCRHTRKPRLILPSPARPTAGATICPSRMISL